MDFSQTRFLKNERNLVCHKFERFLNLEKLLRKRMEVLASDSLMPIRLLQRKGLLPACFLNGFGSAPGEEPENVKEEPRVKQTAVSSFDQP
jgi:hypothetical protein